MSRRHFVPEIHGPCGRAFRLVEEHDAYACLHCDIWLEPRCTDEDCVMCRTRPDRPSDLEQSAQDWLTGAIRLKPDEHLVLSAAQTLSSEQLDRVAASLPEGIRGRVVITALQATVVPALP